MEINKQIFALGVFRVNFLYNLLMNDVYHGNKDEREENKDDLEFYEKGYGILCENLRIENLVKQNYTEIKARDFNNNSDADIFYSLRYLAIDLWEAGRQLLGKYGFDYTHEYDISTILAFYAIVTDQLINLNRLEGEDFKIHFVSDEYFFSSETALYNFKERLTRLIKEIEKSNLISEKQLSKLSNILDRDIVRFDSEWIKSLNSIIYNFINLIYVQFESLETNKTRYIINKDKLHECLPGFENWREFEEICERILEFALIPQFSRLYVQVRSDDQHERRDIVVPNTLYNGVWNSLFYQYNCNNIVFEIKNKRKKFTKEDVNQLRIYLSKPTIGKFGLLIIRGGINKSIKKAIRYCYSDESIMILTLDDEDLKELMLTKSIFGKVDLFVEKKKISFELDY